ncbi:hypothetical protein L596_004558 [Steinernema carpocapsae]|uniref:Uncharacterized protein n=1 Tax=Steinernema carpocapsae TaxID=34508 RepID=A0A4V6YSX7_STECR|nr:hypothetical protein L596_004558 [Steinernema carpocapsae]
MTHLLQFGNAKGPKGDVAITHDGHVPIAAICCFCGAEVADQLKRLVCVGSGAEKKVRGISGMQKKKYRGVKEAARQCHKNKPTSESAVFCNARPASVAAVLDQSRHLYYLFELFLALIIERFSFLPYCCFEYFRRTYREPEHRGIEVRKDTGPESPPRAGLNDQQTAKSVFYASVL